MLIYIKKLIKPLFQTSNITENWFFWQSIYFPLPPPHFVKENKNKFLQKYPTSIRKLKSFLELWKKLYTSKVLKKSIWLKFYYPYSSKLCSFTSIVPAQWQIDEEWVFNTQFSSSSYRGHHIWLNLSLVLEIHNMDTHKNFY